jgi:monoamine oxidase
LVREFVENFHAAELDRISEKAVAEGGNPGEDASEQRMGRLIEGYGSIVEWLAKPVYGAIRLERVVTNIDWSPGRVSVSARGPSGRTEIFNARAVIITVPVSLLHASARGRGALAIAPEVPSMREAAACGAMGHVQRIVLLLDRPLVESLPERRQRQLSGLSVLQATGLAVPVWWTSYPLRSRLVVGWAGGPSALALERSSTPLRENAISSLASAFGLDRRRIARQVEKSFTHDWSSDPYARGGYSYPVVGGSDVAKRLSRPIRGTLFIAGEAADEEERNGTVPGAIASGYRAAEQAKKAIGRA